ncbi:MAG: hypothetical protein DHS20C21_11330 [Gemmatimonadota bacterium]|nr:MAG: hypothetical protein DHS20C21_11330 [Gemmatimonadota bacterium]
MDREWRSWIVGVVCTLAAGSGLATGTAVAGDAAIARDDGGAPAGHGLQTAIGQENPAAYVRELDRLLFADLVAGTPEAERPEAPPWNLKLLQRSLDPASVMLVFHPDGEVVWAAAISHDQVVPRKLNAPHTNALGPRLQAWAHGPPGRPLDRHAASAIHQNLFFPFEAETAAKRHVIVAASGVLRDLPFEILLMTPATEEHSVTEMPFLVRRFEFAYEPTVASRLGWSSRPGGLRRIRRHSVDDPDSRVVAAGTLIAVAHEGPSGSGMEALGWLREGAGACLLGGDEGGLDVFLKRFYRERAGGRRSIVRAVHRTRLGLLGDGLPPEIWARPMLYGAE